MRVRLRLPEPALRTLHRRNQRIWGIQVNQTVNDLLGVVDLLTLPRFEHLAQEHEDGMWKIVTCEVPPMLQMFGDAVRQFGERSEGGSGSSRSTRIPFDAEALEAYTRMTATAAGWVRDAGLVPTRDPVKDLRVWYSVTLSDNTRDDDWFRVHLNGWVGRIRDHLEPPESFVIRHACPVCKVASWGDAIGGGDVWPIEVRYRKDDDGRMFGEVARCRAGCGTVWRGHGAIMELAEEVNETLERTTLV